MYLLKWHRRISRVVQNPVVGSIGQMLMSFNSASKAFVETFPEMEGKPFGEIYKWYVSYTQSILWA